MINDLISREALKKVISDAYEKYDGYEPNDLGRFAEMVDEAIDNAPTVEPYTENDVIEGIRAGYKDGYEAAKAKFERPQGKWVNPSENPKIRFKDLFYDCSICGGSNLNKRNFCPNCGADMRGES